MESRLTAVYRIRGPADAAAERAEAIAVEQSVEMPVAGIDDRYVLDEIVGRVEDVVEVGDGLHEARVSLAVATVGGDAGQLINMLFGNSSLHEDVTLQDFDVPADLARQFGGPRHGIDGLRLRTGVVGRALTGSALKPQGIPVDRLAVLAERLALGGIDCVKDDHGFADQAYAPVFERISTVAEALRRAADRTGRRTCYIPSLSGDLDRCCRQLDCALAEGVDTVMVAPMIAGVSNVQALVRRYPDAAFIAHPTMAGSACMAPAALYGRLFRLIGADGVVFPNHGGRFGYSAATCRALTDTARTPWHRMASALPIPAGGMTLARVPDMLDFYGRDVMLLIGGALLATREGLPEASASLAAAVAAHHYR